MDTDEIVRKYIDAWNEKDVAALLDLMHTGAAYYDAFWMETCVGRDLDRYFQDAMDEEPYLYAQIGDAIETENGVVFRYSAHDYSGPEIGAFILQGAEILGLHGGKIITVSDIYCSPSQSDLEELAELAATRHGLTTHANAGLGALKAARIKASLSRELDKDKAYLDPTITMSELAERIGCTFDQLSTVIENQFGTHFGEVLDTQRIEYAKELLEKDPGNADLIPRVAASAGFSSVTEFRKKFGDKVGISPVEFCRRHELQRTTKDGRRLH